MKPFTKIVTGFWRLIISEKSVFTDVCQGSKILNWSLHLIMDICDVLRYLVPFSQFRKREKQLWRSAALSTVSGFFHGCFSRF